MCRKDSSAAWESGAGDGGEGAGKKKGRSRPFPRRWVPSDQVPWVLDDGRFRVGGRGPGSLASQKVTLLGAGGVEDVRDEERSWSHEPVFR